MTFDVRENERKMSVYAGVFGLFNFAAVVAEMKARTCRRHASVRQP
jgi:hypothetical protein